MNGGGWRPVAALAALAAAMLTIAACGSSEADPPEAGGDGTAISADGPDGSPSADEGDRVDAAPRRVKARVRHDIPYLGPGGPTLDLHHPGGRSDRPAVMVIHGGGWIARDKEWTRPIAQELAKAGFVAFNVNFTLADEGRPGFPIQLEELRAALRFLRARAEGIGFDPARIGVYGSSSGAHLAALLASTGRGPLTEGGRVGAAVSWGGGYELNEFDGPERWRQRIETFLGCWPCPARARKASPLHNVSPDDPPMLILHSENETIPLEQAERMAEVQRSRGVPGRLMVLPGKAHIPIESPEEFRVTVRFLKRQLGNT